MESVRIGVVGVGAMGRQYVAAIPTIDGLELTALCNRTLDKIQDLPGEKFSDYRHMIASGRVDAVVLDNVLAERRQRAMKGFTIQPDTIAIGHYVGVLAASSAPLLSVSEK